jgi:arginine/lysine/ornithine decarboxylase
MLSIPQKGCINAKAPQFKRLKKQTSIREAAFSPSKCLPAEQCLGRVVAMTSVGCPPAVPIAVAGEVIDENAIECFKYYGIENCNVIK